MQSLCAFSYPRAYNSLLLLISTLGLLRRYFVDYCLPPPYLGNVGTRHAESVSALVIGHGMPCPYHSIVSLENRVASEVTINPNLFCTSLTYSYP